MVLLAFLLGFPWAKGAQGPGGAIAGEGCGGGQGPPHPPSPIMDTLSALGPRGPHKAFKSLL